MKKAKKIRGNTTVSNQKSGQFTADEIAAMRERARELREEARNDANKAEGERALLAKIAALKGSDRAMATRIHAIIKTNAPTLSPKTWYGMPAYANKDGKVICYFTPASKFESRYATFGFNDDANLDEGAMWPTSFALKKMTATEEKKVAALVKKAVS